MTGEGGSHLTPELLRHLPDGFRRATPRGPTITIRRHARSTARRRPDRRALGKRERGRGTGGGQGEELRRAVRRGHDTGPWSRQSWR